MGHCRQSAALVNMRKMEEYGEIKSVSTGKNKDGTREVRLLNVEIRPDDIVTVELDANSTTDYVPRIGARVYFNEITSTYLVATRIIDDELNIDKDLGSGERLSYAIDDSGEAVSTIRQTSGGDIILDKGTDYAVAFMRLQAAFNQLVIDHNALVAAVNAITLPILPATPAVAGPLPLPIAVPSVADMSSAKVDKVRV